MGNQSKSWARRVAERPVPSTLYHATTPKKLARYLQTGTILPPVRGFDTRNAAEQWAREKMRTIIVTVTPAPRQCWPLPDHHRSDGVAWWSTQVDITSHYALDGLNSST